MPASKLIQNQTFKFLGVLPSCDVVVVGEDSKREGQHFNLKGHKVSDMRVRIIEKIFSQGAAIRKEREKFYIMKINTKYKGLNQCNLKSIIAICFF